MPLETIEGRTGESPNASIIILHGLGADANDFVPFAQQLDLRAVGDVRFVFPNAPVRPVTVFGGQRVRAWFDFYETDFGRREDETALRESRAEVQSLIDREIALGIPASRIVLAGFSQGCAMTLLTGVRAPQRLAGLMGLSGWLPLADTTAAEGSEANRDVPIFLAHGTADPIVPHARGAAARDTLAGLGYPVEFHDYPMQHSVSDAETRDAHAWLLKVLAKA
jgi:phospholipase/carboxylesterase